MMATWWMAANNAKDMRTPVTRAACAARFIYQLKKPPNQSCSALRGDGLLQLMGSASPASLAGTCRLPGQSLATLAPLAREKLAQLTPCGILMARLLTPRWPM